MPIPTYNNSRKADYSNIFHMEIIMSLLKHISYGDNNVKHIIQLDKPACCAPKIMFLKWC